MTAPPSFSLREDLRLMDLLEQQRDLSDERNLDQVRTRLENLNQKHELSASPEDIEQCAEAFLAKKPQVTQVSGAGTQKVISWTRPESFQSWKRLRSIADKFEGEKLELTQTSTLSQCLVMSMFGIFLYNFPYFLQTVLFPHLLSRVTNPDPGFLAHFAHAFLANGFSFFKTVSSFFGVVSFICGLVKMRNWATETSEPTCIKGHLGSLLTSWEASTPTELAQLLTPYTPRADELRSWLAHPNAKMALTHLIKDEPVELLVQDQRHLNRLIDHTPPEGERGEDELIRDRLLWEKARDLLNSQAPSSMA